MTKNATVCDNCFYVFENTNETEIVLNMPVYGKLLLSDVDSAEIENLLKDEAKSHNAEYSDNITIVVTNKLVEIETRKGMADRFMARLKNNAQLKNIYSGLNKEKFIPDE